MNDERLIYQSRQAVRAQEVFSWQEGSKACLVRAFDKAFARFEAEAKPTEDGVFIVSIEFLPDPR